jgi:hypothetical protein
MAQQGTRVEHLSANSREMSVDYGIVPANGGFVSDGVPDMKAEDQGIHRQNCWNQNVRILQGDRIAAATTV